MLQFEHAFFSSLLSLPTRTRQFWILESLVYLHMRSKVATFGETLITTRAQVRPLTCMPTHVDLECATPHKFLVTILAGKGSVSRVTSHMIGEVALGSEAAFTRFKRAFVGFFSVVNSHVGFKITPFGELLVAAVPVATEGFDARL